MIYLKYYVLMLDDIDMMSCHSGPQPMLFRVEKAAIFDGRIKLILMLFIMRCFFVFGLGLCLSFSLWDSSEWLFTPAAKATLRLLHLPKYLRMCGCLDINIEHVYQIGRLTHAHTSNLM